MITTESNLELEPCKVNDDHTLTYRKKTVKIKDDRPAHIMTVPCNKIWPTFLGRRLAPKRQRFNVYTIQQTGEVTHDPHKDQLDEKQKMRFEKLIQIQAVSTKAAIAQNIMKGLKDKGAWWEILGPIIAIVLIVAFFLFAFQVQPNL
jgi:hypothetical protein